MLVLSRKSGQGIQMSIAGISIEVSVIQIAGNRVKIGLAAPDSVSILRSELVFATVAELQNGIDCDSIACPQPGKKLN